MPTPPDAPTNLLAHPIASIKGVGEKTCSALQKSGINTIFEAMLRVPKSVVEEMECPGFAHMEAGRTYVARGRVVGVKLSGMGLKKRLEAVVEDDSGRMTVVFFGPAVNYVQNTLKTNAELIFTGEAKNFLGRMQMVHPKVAVAKDDNINPVNQANYSQVAGVTSPTYKKIIEKSLKLLSSNNHADHLDEHFLEENQFLPLIEALQAIHQPGRLNQWDERASDPSFRRLAFEEILSFFLHLFRERSAEKPENAVAITPILINQLLENFLPFSLTRAQERVIGEIISDMGLKKPMSRLIQGDVGSGKTAVSAVVARHAAQAEFQVAIMAPTEILAEQLFGVYQKLFAGSVVKVALLTASTKTKERRELTSQILEHEVHIVVGTHALLSEDVVFKKLGLVIIDEQHRFGVNQRAALVEKFFNAQGFSPHLMVMSATPIPRSLALTMYGDLDLSVIDERPPGRTPVLTKILAGDPIKNLDKLCERIIASEQKAFVVFPLVEESEHLDLENASKAALLLQKRFGASSARLLHGKMKPDEKQQAMADFRDNKFRFLVATTVVEVGVDIPDATCMAIIHPERFGLAQLHQLRGRVGRGSLASFCFLLTNVENKFSSAYHRLNAMCKSDNGFELAQVDLKIRGPGELMGTRQAGVPNFLVFNHTDFASLVEPAKQLAKVLAKTEVSVPIAHLFAYQSPHFS
jgi:ATP-dependent DNA helicase RecG